jgi:Thiol:disulfide interchange protein
MKRNRVVFYILVSVALILCIAGVLRYDRNEERGTVMAHQPFVTTPAFGTDYDADVTFFSSYAEAASAAREQEKPILLLFTAKNCVYSRQMTETTFQSDVVKPFLQRFVLVNIDVNQQKEVSRWLNIETTPTIQFLSAQGVPLQRINGVTQPEDLLVQMNSTLQTIASHSSVQVR